MIIAFYKVNNSLNYERHEFDTDRPETIIEKLQRLPEDEVKLYDGDNYSWQGKEPTLADFEYDYNNEELDGDWWCIIINYTKQKEKKQTLEGMVKKHDVPDAIFTKEQTELLNEAILSLMEKNNFMWKMSANGKVKAMLLEENGKLRRLQETLIDYFC